MNRGDVPTRQLTVHRKMLNLKRFCLPDCGKIWPMVEYWTIQSRVSTKGRSDRMTQELQRREVHLAEAQRLSHTGSAVMAVIAARSVHIRREGIERHTATGLIDALLGCARGRRAPVRRCRAGRHANHLSAPEHHCAEGSDPYRVDAERDEDVSLQSGPLGSDPNRPARR